MTRRIRGSYFESCNRDAFCPAAGWTGVPLKVIQRQLGHANLGVTSIYLQGIQLGGVK
jgi:site-specific recombinase XerD